MNSALLRQEQLELYSPILIENKLGEYESDWQYERTVRAGLMSQSMNRGIEADRITYDLSRTFIVRRYVEVEDTWRIKWNNKMWRIISIEDNKYYNDKTILVDVVDE